jgi:4-amino-4-deoxy-L-arabinose transferase-like glycosyltransferase
VNVLRTRPPWADGVVVFAAFVWLALLAWWRPLRLPDEGRYIGVAWEMLRSGQWLTPTLDGLPYFHKPPLFYWITASALGVFGPHEWAARAAPLLGAVVGVVAVFAFARRWSGPRLAWLAAVALLTQPLFYLGGQFANLDMLVAGFITATVLLLADASLRVERQLPHRMSLLGAYAAAALGVLAKGLIGFVIPALVLLAWLAITRRLRRVAVLISPSGALLFIAIAAPWFVAMQRHHPGFFDYFFVEQHVRRYAAGGFNNVQAWWFYVALLALVTLPWWPWYARLLRRADRSDPMRHDLRLLMAAWALVVLLFFSLPASKLVGYILPALPPLAWLAADGFAALAAAPSRASRAMWAGTAVLLSGLSVAVLALMVRDPGGSSLALARELARQRLPMQPVLAIDSYPFDLAFYAGLREPVVVLGDWSDPRLRQSDSWRKELVDAGDFAPALRDRVLVPRESLAARLCATPLTWVVTSREVAALHPPLAGANPVAVSRDLALWAVSRDAAAGLVCREMPNAGSP